jgi:hypothetical protein
MSRLTVDFTEDATPIFENFDEQVIHIAHTQAPWFADIVNNLVTGQIPLHWGRQDKSKFSRMILICSSTIPIRSLGGVFMSMTNSMSSPFVMIMPMEAI